MKYVLLFGCYMTFVLFPMVLGIDSAMGQKTEPQPGLSGPHIINQGDASITLGQKALEFQVKDMDGKELSLSQYKGKWVLLDFWAVWCGPCRREMDSVLEVYKKYHDKGFEIIGISLDRNAGQLKEYIAKKSIPWRQYYDGNGWRNAVAVKYKVHSIPYTYLINPEGIIVGRRLRGPYLEKAIKDAFESQNIDKP